jgi:hypothetical protein
VSSSRARQNRRSKGSGDHAPQPPAQSGPIGLSLLFEQIGLYTSIFRAERVRYTRFRFAKALRLQLGGVETLRGEIGDDGRCAPFRQAEIILFGAGRVGMAIDFKTLAFETCGSLTALAN